MPTEEFEKILNRAQAIGNAEPLIDVACPLLRELVNHGSHVLARCAAARDVVREENEDGAALALYRHLLEVIDGAEVLLSHACADAAVGPLRAAFEASLALDFILQTEPLYVRRSLSWLYCHARARIRTIEALDPNSPAGRDYQRAYSAQFGSPAPTLSPEHQEEARQSLQSLNRFVSRSQFQSIAAEYERLRAVKQRPRWPHWYELFEGPKTLRELASTVGRIAEYLSVYDAWSKSVHGLDAARYLTTGSAPGSTAILSLRNAQHLQFTAGMAANIMVRQTRLMIQFFRPGENLTPWYVREIQGPLRTLQHLDVRFVDPESS
jgi:hypothetical protein